MKQGMVWLRIGQGSPPGVGSTMMLRVRFVVLSTEKWRRHGPMQGHRVLGCRGSSTHDHWLTSQSTTQAPKLQSRSSTVSPQAAPPAVGYTTMLRPKYCTPSPQVREHGARGTKGPMTQSIGSSRRDKPARGSACSGARSNCAALPLRHPKAVTKSKRRAAAACVRGWL